MKNSVTQELFIVVLLVILLLLFLNPLNLWMPSMLHMMLLAGFMTTIALFFAFVWRERVRDEREGLHRLFAGRFAFLVGVGVLAIGVVVQSFMHAIDPWLITAFIAMIAAKVLASAYGRTRR